MTDRDIERFETAFAERVRSYTDRATERRVDALAISRTAMARSAMSPRPVTGWSGRRLGAGLLGRGIGGAGWAAAFVAVVLIGVVGVAILGRLSDSVIGPQPTLSPAPSATGPVPEALRHSWQRPYAVTPDLDQWPSGSLTLAGDQVDFGPEPAAASRSAIVATGPDTLAITATGETQGCAIGDIGAYRWSVTGQGTVMTLTAINPDACASREEALAGQWVRSDLPPPAGPEVTLPPGTFETKAFDPFGDPALSRRLAYTVPTGWKVKEDDPTVFLLHHLPDASSGEPSTDLFLSIFVQPRLAADSEDGAICGPVGASPGAGTGIDDLVAAIVARPGVVSTPPPAVTIGGFGGQILDVHLAPDWTGGCRAPEGPVVGMPILVQGGSGGPVCGVSLDHPLRLILLDLGRERTIAISIFSPEPTEQLLFDEQAASVMPIIESFEVRPPTP